MRDGQAMRDPHVPEELLIGYANGAISPALALLVSAHLEQAERSLEIVSDLQAAGGALMLDDVPATLAEGALDQVLAAIDDDPGAPAGETVRAELDPGPLPAELIQVIGVDFDQIPWKLRLPGIAEYEIEGFGAERVCLVRGRPGAGIPQHTHSGNEITLVLTGALQDGDMLFEAGDISINDEHDEHMPRVTGCETCYCLVVLSGPLRFTGMFSRALNYFT
ncbi:MAG: ChrR family anti-sigma-E factor [Pikeienuella sp.]